MPSALPPAETVPAPLFGAGGRFDAAFPGRQSAIAPPPDAPVMAMGSDGAEPPPVGPRDVTALALMNQPTATGGPQATMPGATVPVGGPPPPNQQIAQAPPPPAATIRVAPPPEPVARQGDTSYVVPMPGKREPPPTMTEPMQRIQKIIRDAPPAYKDSVAARLKPLYDAEQAKVTLGYEAYKTGLTLDKQQELEHYKSREGLPQRAATAEKTWRELEGEGATPLTSEQRKAYGIPETQSAYLTRRGEIKFGPAGSTVTVHTGDKAQGKGDEKLQEKLSEHFVKTFEAGDTAGDDIKQLAEMRALAAKVGTGAGAVVKQYLGGWGIKSEGLSEIQALQAGISRLIPQQRVPGSGTSSDFDSQMFKDSVVGLSKTPQGNALIFDTMDGLAKNKLDRAEVAGRVVSGEITRSEGIKEMLALQRQARDLSDRVKVYVMDKGGNQPQPAIPKEINDATMRELLKNNPNHPRADEIRRKLGM